MKRDMDLARMILLDLEQNDIPRYEQLKLDGYDEERIGYHCYLLAQAGLIVAVDATDTENILPNYIPSHLTWDGHEFLNGIKAPSDWERIKKSVIQPAGGFVFSFAKEYILHELKTRTGIS
ncbi:DUF2513 domain-containing protein [Massilia sp. YIM B02769]|uniref:DUF2513 domain-containing protein n=1 Tax=Massilia sp. YIM B02769 TaxID=3050129 RepID=UPI0025B6FA05|nr:DUF2513 domain-containing protein [Massilia sp. YIM B02769]MDN4061278.1 DUF2513 domain-containing protein [Massilia sp. YIM B02769]